NNNFKGVLAAGRHVFWKGLNTLRFDIYDTSTLEIPKSINRQLYERVPFSYYVRQFKVEPTEIGLLFVDGVFVKEVKPGTYFFWKNTTTIQLSKVDLRLTSMDVVGQEILTKDKAQVRINFAIQYKVTDVMKAILENKNFDQLLYAEMQFALREYIGNMTLDALMENKGSISEYVIEATKAQIAQLGVTLMSAGVKDIILPGEIRKIMNEVLMAEKKAQANIITRREETASTRSLLNTAKMLEENAMLYKLKEMEYVEKIAEKVNAISVSGNGQIVDQLKQLFVK